MKFLAAAAFAVALSLTGLVSATPASAASPTATVSTDAASQSTDISARRYYRRYGYRPYYYARPYYAPRYYRPYYAPRPYYGGYGYGGPGIRFGF